MLAQLESGRGALLMGAHMGSFEVMHSLGRRRRGLNVAMAMYEENARKINAILAAINPHLVPTIIPLGRIDAMLNIAERLDGGAFVGVLGDRTLGDEPVQPVTLLGERAYLPTGPMRAAAILRCPVFFMAGLYRGKNNYHVVFERIADFSGIPGRPRSRGSIRDRALRRRARSALPQRSLQLVQFLRLLAAAAGESGYDAACIRTIHAGVSVRRGRRRGDGGTRGRRRSDGRSR